MRQNQ